MQIGIVLESSYWLVIQRRLVRLEDGIFNDTASTVCDVESGVDIGHYHDPHATAMSTRCGSSPLLRDLLDISMCRLATARRSLSKRGDPFMSWSAIQMNRACSALTVERHCFSQTLCACRGAIDGASFQGAMLKSVWGAFAYVSSRRFSSRCALSEDTFALRRRCKNACQTGPVARICCMRFTGVMRLSRADTLG